MMRTVTVLACVAVLVGGEGRAAPPPAEDLKYRRAFDGAVDRGLAYLARGQAANGSIGGDIPAITSLAVMAFLARGYTPGLPPYGNVINRGIDYILSIPAANGALMGGGGQMYSHNIATLMLAEVSGMVDPERQTRIDAVLPKAIKLTLAAQEVRKGDPHEGGWRYEPASVDSDISHSGWALMTLRAARNNGAPVPKEAIEKAVRFILRCRTQDNGFAYQPGGASGVARTGIGLLCLELAGRHRDDVTLKAGKYLASAFKQGLPGEFRYYAFYYSAHGMYQLGGPEWEAFAPGLYDGILKLQSADGSWPAAGGQENNPQYCTSMAILALSVTYCQLPIYQR